LVGALVPGFLSWRFLLMVASWLHRLLKSKSRPAPRRRPGRTSSAWLVMEALESRWVLSQAFQVIPQPIAPYLAQTSKLAITEPDLTTVASLTDGTETASFSALGQALTVPATWATWSSPPDSESDTPRVLLIRNFTLETTIALDAPVLTFGFE